MKGWHGLIALVLVTPALAGCIGGQDAQLEDASAPSGADDPGLENLSAPEAFEYVCPPGETTERENGLCVREIVDRTTSLQEPYIAVNHDDPSLIALGVNAGYTDRAPQTESNPGARAVDLDVYVSEDGGETFEHRPLPYVPEDDSGPVDVSAIGDPAFAWTKDDRLYASGIVNHKIGVRGYEVFAAHSDDNGETWSSPTTFTGDDDNDRQWMNLGPTGTAYVPWQNVGNSTQLAWQAPNASWQGPTEAATVEDCITVSRMAFPNGTPLLACAGYGDQGLDGLQVYRFDREAGELTQVSKLDNEAVWPQLVTLPNEKLVMTGQTHGSVKAWTSADAGQNWSQPVDLRELLSAEDDWFSADLKWVTADPWGGVHVLLEGNPCDQELANVCVAIGPSEVVHAAFSPSLDEVLVEQRLDPPDTSREEHQPESAGPSYGDHYFGIDFGPERGYLVWTEDKALEMTTIQPAGNATS